MRSGHQHRPKTELKLSRPTRGIMANHDAPTQTKAELAAVDSLYKNAPEVFVHPPPPMFDQWLVVPVEDPSKGFPAELEAHDVESEPPLDSDAPSVPAVRPTEAGKAEYDPSEFDYDDAGLLVQLGVGDRFPGAPREPDPQFTAPIDCWAAYLPFHYFYPSSWGIYLTYEGVEVIARYLGEFAPGSAEPERRNAAHFLLYFHEFFHHIVECFATRLEVTHRRPLYVREFQALFEKQLPDADEEAIATAYALDRCKGVTPKISKAVQGALVELVKEMPPGYARGAELLRSLETTKFKYLNDLQESAFPAPKKDPAIWDAFPHALDGFGRRSSKVSYLIHVGSPLGTRLRARLLRYRDLERILRQAGCEIVGHNKHEKWRAPDGRTAPVPRHPGDMALGTLKSITMKLLGKTPRELGLR
jgi:hypothetical protein